MTPLNPRFRRPCTSEEITLTNVVRWGGRMLTVRNACKDSIEHVVSRLILGVDSRTDPQLTHFIYTQRQQQQHSNISLNYPQNIMQIVTGIEVSSEAYFPKLGEYCPSAKGTRAIFPQLQEIRLTTDRR